MLQGEVPFKSVNLTTQINKMKSAYSELFNKIKYSMSDEVKNLLRKLLTYNPADRISIKAIKKHQWIILNRQIIDENFKFIEKILFEKYFFVSKAFVVSTWFLHKTVIRYLFVIFNLHPLKMVLMEDLHFHWVAW